MTVLTRRGLLGAAAMMGAVPLTLSDALAAKPAPDLEFVLHAVFFSEEMRLAKPLDPHAFVQDSAAQAGVGPQMIKHAAGVRPAFVAGPFDVEVYNAQGRGLGFTLKDWFAAKGTVRITPARGGAKLACRFTGLLPNGLYSLFENHFDQKPIGFTPSDGTGKTNTFNADANGDAAITIMSPKPLTHANAVLLVYHSDNQAHGMQRGEIGVTAHHQIIARVPA